MLIPSIDLMGAKIVQLVQGERKALEFDNFPEWVERFRRFPIVQVIDLDAAMARGNNRQLVRQLCAELSCQVGGGLRAVETAAEVLSAGARKVIIGSSLLDGGNVNVAFARELAANLGADRLIFAVDSRDGHVATKGWTQSAGVRPADAIRRLDPFCSGFLYTHIESEGLMRGFPISVIDELRQVTGKKLIAAGGITTVDEVNALDSLGVDAVVGMAIYTGKMDVSQFPQHPAGF